MQHRYVFGPGMDAPIVEYAGTGTSNRTFLTADERGSIIARSGNTGALSAANSYDEYGIPGSGNAGLFQYTGQAWIAQLGMQYSKARFYSPTLGRFMQTDPIGYGDNANLYAYAGNDPVNGTDPMGLCGSVWSVWDSPTNAFGPVISACPENAPIEMLPAFLTITNRDSRLGGAEKVVGDRSSPQSQQQTRPEPPCSTFLDKMDQVGSDLQWAGLLGGGAMFAAGAATAQLEAVEGGVDAGGIAYAIGSTLRDSSSVAHLLRGSGNGSGYTFSQFNEALIGNMVPKGFLHDFVSSLLSKFEEHEGLTNGDAPICPTRR